MGSANGDGENQASQKRCCECESATANVAASCSAPAPKEYEKPEDCRWVSGHIDTPAGEIPVASTTLEFADHFGTWKARWGVNRMDYAMAPGLYAAGNPGPDSPVFVTANYKMSFDALRSQLKDISSWILVLDTRGINVWCAAGKGTFGTDELVNRIKATRLSEIVSHKRLVVPQLGAPGVSAHEVKKRSGYRVVYGPVRADDIPRFMDNDSRAAPDMRRVEFGLFDRLALIPLEITHAGKRLFWGTRPLVFVVLLFALSGLGRSGFSIDKALRLGACGLGMYVAAFLCGAILTPLLLPWLPGRAFSIKGAFLGFLVAFGTGWLRWGAPGVLGARVNILAWLFLVSALSSFLAVSFVGASTYTSLSGVFKEMRRAVPIQIAMLIVGVVLLISGQFI